MGKNGLKWVVLVATPTEIQRKRSALKAPFTQEF